MANMVAGDGGQDAHAASDRGLRPNSTTVSPWPQPFDFDSDSLKPGNTDIFQRQMIDALQTRQWWESLTTHIPSLEEARAMHPHLDDATIMRAIAAATRQQDDIANLAAPNILRCVKLTALTHVDPPLRFPSGTYLCYVMLCYVMLFN